MHANRQRTGHSSRGPAWGRPAAEGVRRLGYTSLMNDMRREIAHAAARLIADGGLDYASAKQRAAREIIGDGRPPRDALPDGDEIDAALLEHLSLFDEEHEARLARLRACALELMDDWAEFHPLVTGAAWKGIATEFAMVHLQLFHDNAKEIQYALLNRGIDFDTVTVPHFRTGEEIEGYTFHWHDEPVLLSAYGSDDLRGALRAGRHGAPRGGRAALAALMAGTP